MKLNTVHKPKKSSGKIRNSSAQPTSDARKKKSLSKQKSTCTMKRTQKPIHTNFKEHMLEALRSKTRNNHLIDEQESAREKERKMKPKIESSKILKSGTRTKNKSSKSKSKSPSVNLQSGKKKSP